MTTPRPLVPVTTCLVLALAADVRADAQLWLEGGASLKAAKRVEVDVSPQVRFDQDVSRFSAFLPELTVHYRFERWLRAGAGYRLEYERDNDGVLVVRHRVSTDVRVRAALGNVRFDNRLMVMEQFRPDTKDPYRAVIRERLVVSYQGFEAWAPFMSAEPFFILGDLDQFSYQKLRLTAGVDRGLRDHEVEVFVRAELHADAMDPTFYILGLGYHYDL